MEGDGTWHNLCPKLPTTHPPGARTQASWQPGAPKRKAAAPPQLHPASMTVFEEQFYSYEILGCL